MLAINQIRRRVLFGIQLLTFTWGMHGNAFAGSIGATANPFDASDAEPGLSVAVEYYHPGLDHYFLTADPTEIQALANGRFQGWVTTGQKFAVLPPDSTVDTSTPVCRFYSQRLGSHFYSAQPNECDEVKVRFSDSWTLESDDVYRAFLPDAWGACPLGTQAVYRLWNNRADSNHRYTTDPSIAMTMKAKGYVAEGLGLGLSLPVALCAPVGIACALAVSDPAPATGSQVTLTATCTGQPSSYVWSGCDSKTDTCSTTSVDVGIKAYGVVARAPTGVSDATAIAVDWRPLVAGTPAQPPSCTISASNITPAAGTSVTLSVLCTVLPTSYSWTGCTSTGNSCTTSSAGAGAATYTVSATTPAGNASPASITINWQGPSTATSNPTPSTPTPNTTPTPSPAPTTNAARTPIAAIPAGEARAISSNVLADVWQGAPPQGGGTIYKGVHAWNSGIFAPLLGANGSLIFRGGGDADSWDTAVFAFDIASGAWSRIKDRTNALSWNPSADVARPVGDPQRWDATYAEHGDGTPGVPHTYDLDTYLPPEAGGGPKGSLLYPVARFAYLYSSTNWSHKFNIDTRADSRASTAPVPSNPNLLGMSDYDPTTKRVWVVPATGTGAYVNAIAYIDYADGSGVGVPGSVDIGGEFLVYNGTMRFWRGTDGTKRYLVMLSFDPRSRLNIIDLDAPQTGVHALAIANTPPNFGYPNSGFALGKSIGFAMHPDPATDNSAIYEIEPPADAIHGTWQVTPKPLTGITLAVEGNQGLYKRLEWHEGLGVATFYISAGGPVFAYRPGTGTTTNSSPPSTPAPAPAPTPVPPPVVTSPALAGSLKLSSVAVSYTGPGATLGVSKNLEFARVANRWYKCAGDHRSTGGNTPDFQDGRQEIFSFNVPSNDWRTDQPYFVRSATPNTDLQIALPDDAFCIARGSEIWSFVSERVDQMNTADQTTSARSGYGGDIVIQDMSNIGAWDINTRKWRSILPVPLEMRGDRAWHGIYDAQTDRFIIPLASSFLQISGSGQDISPRFGANNVLMDYGNFDFHATGIVQDGRNAYVYDASHGALYALNLDASPFTLTKVLDLPELTYALAGRGIYMAWHPVLRAVVLQGVNGKMYAFEVDSKKLTKWDRPDGFVNGAGNYVPAQALFYDSDTQDVVSVGGIDWDTGMASPVYWRMQITR